MDYYSLSDNQLTQLLGARLRALRLRRNRSQADVALSAGVGERTLQAMESGKGKLENFIAVLRELQALDSLDGFLPEPQVSPLDLARREGKVRRRAGRKPKTAQDGEEEGAGW